MKAILKENISGEISNIKTTVEASWKEDIFTIRFECHNSQRYCPFTKDNDPLYEGDVCEVFITSKDALNDYFEFEIAPNGCVFCAKVYRNPLTEERVLTMLPHLVFSAVDPLTDGYSAILGLPLQALGLFKREEIRLNIFRIETDGGNHIDLLALNPTRKSTFHVPEAFLPW